MPHFFRTFPAPSNKSGYRKYRPFVRNDFLGQCAYCLMTELLAGGAENFELDHFRPKAQFPELVNDFHNIYYSCHPCNHTKLDTWPSPELTALGYSFVDLCSDDFDKHFEALENGEWQGITGAGRYTIDALRLNRQHLVTLRQLLSKLHCATHERKLEERLRILFDYR